MNDKNIVRPEHSSPSDDRAKELNDQVKILAGAANKPWHKTATGWFAFIAAIASIIGALASLLAVTG